MCVCVCMSVWVCACVLCLGLGFMPFSVWFVLVSHMLTVEWYSPFSDFDQINGQRVCLENAIQKMQKVRPELLRTEVLQITRVGMGKLSRKNRPRQMVKPNLGGSSTH